MSDSRKAGSKGGSQVGRIKNTLNKVQAETVLIKEEAGFGFVDVSYELDMTSLLCSEVPFICVKFGQGKKPKPGFGLEGDPDNDALYGCTRAPSCVGKNQKLFDIVKTHLQNTLCHSLP